MAQKRTIHEVGSKKQPVGFRIVDGVQGITSLFQKLGGAQGRALIQIPGQAFPCASSLISETQVPGEFHLVALPPEEQLAFDREIKKDPKTSCLILVPVQNESLMGFRVPYLGREGSTLRFRFPDRVVRIERRRDERYVIPPAYEIYVEIHGERHRLLDISRSGLGFHVESKMEAGKYAPGSRFRGSFRIQGQLMSLEMEMREHIQLRESAAGPGVKVGVRFHGLRDSDSEFLAEYVILNLVQF